MREGNKAREEGGVRPWRVFKVGALAFSPCEVRGVAVEECCNLKRSF